MEEKNFRELRIGNLVNWYEEGVVNDIIEVHAVSIDEVNHKINPEQIRPIPLDESWLAKFGAEDISYTNWQGRNTLFKIVIDGSEYFIERSEWVSDSKWALTIESDDYERMKYQTVLLAYVPFVHSLQNAIFALTGQELTAPSFEKKI